MPPATSPATPYPELQKYYDINFQLPLSNAGVKVAAGQADATNNQREYDIKQQAQNLQDKASGAGYKRAPRADGGFGFTDPDGNEISAYQYARATGKDTSQVLSDSNNPIDAQYIRDYSNLQDFMDASLGGNKEAVSEYYKHNPQLKNLSPGDVIKKFQQAYPTVYGMKQPGQQVGRTFIPNLNQLKQDSGFGADFGGS